MNKRLLKVQDLFARILLFKLIIILFNYKLLIR